MNFNLLYIKKHLNSNIFDLRIYLHNSTGKARTRPLFKKQIHGRLHIHITNAERATMCL